ncbi:hypothetical protein AB0L40_11525 [Patulibacter sp. NPDC049589]
MNDLRNANLVLRRLASLFFVVCGFGVVAMLIPMIIFFATKP